MESSSSSLTSASHEGYWPGMRKSLVCSGDVSTCVPVCVCEEQTACEEGACTRRVRDGVPKSNEEKCILRGAFMPRPTPHAIACTPRSFWGTYAGLRNPETLLLLCYPNCMCSSFTQNNPKQLQGNSAQCADKEPRVVSSGRTTGNPFQPRSIHYGIMPITSLASRGPPRRLPSIRTLSPQHDSPRVCWQN